MKDNYRSKSIVLALLAVTALAQPALSQAIQTNLSKDGYFSSKGAYSGHPADVIGEGVPKVIERTLTNAAVIGISTNGQLMPQRPVIAPVVNTFWLPRWPTEMHYWRVF